MNKNHIYISNIKNGNIFDIEKSLLPFFEDIIGHQDLHILETIEDVIQADYDIHFKSRGVTLEEFKSDYKDDDDLFFNICQSDVFGLYEEDCENGCFNGVPIKDIILHRTLKQLFNLVD